MRRILLIILSLLILLACKENSIENNSLDYGIPYGSWTITSSIPTMGPYCIFIDKGDTVNFIRTQPDTNMFTFRFKSEYVEYNDVYKFEFFETKYFCKGFYNLFMFDEGNNLIDTTLPQTMSIQYINENEINCIISHSAIDLQADTLTFGDVSNFKARKIK
jgi:hypothetical protein